MKKIFTLAMLLVLGLGTSFAQDEEIDNTLQFVDSKGTVVPDGSEITRTEVEDMGFALQISTGLSVKNTSEDNVGSLCEFTILELPTGSEILCCYPMACLPNTNKPGTYKTKGGVLDPNSTVPFSTEWSGMQNYGTAKSTFQLLICEAVFHATKTGGYYTAGDVIANGPKITVNFVYSDPTGINGPTNVTVNRVAERYNAAGARIYAPVKGINILKMEDGSVKKVLVK
ncbi:MAG: hypothetical protein PUJ13_01390 [Bacteroidales bacterium]|nr:hypothetical protein [Bacteroidales bacterium]